MIEWVEELRAGFTAEFGTGPKVITLATVVAGFPRVRTIVCRQVTDDGVLVVASDARSEKNAQLRQTPTAEACVWLATLRRQFRLRGRASVISATGPAEWHTSAGAQRVVALREVLWAELSEAARAMFFWPNPGERRDPDASHFPPSVRTGLPPDTFELVTLFPDYVETLDLRTHPHRRRGWSYDLVSGGMNSEELNP